MNTSLNSVPSWPHSIEAVAFDMDGLLVNTEELYTRVGEILMQRRGREFSRKLKNDITGLPGPKAFALMIEREQLADSVEQLAQESSQIFKEILPNRLRLLAGALELLDRLERDGRPKCVATSSSQEFTKIVLGQTGILHRFQFVITASDVEFGKPHPDIYKAAAQRMGIQPKQMMVLEDSHHGCRAGVASGACTIAVPGPHSIDHDFSGVHFQATTLLDPGIDQLLSDR